jgi:hypothetical protein
MEHVKIRDYIIGQGIDLELLNYEIVVHEEESTMLEQYGLLKDMLR